MRKQNETSEAREYNNLLEKIQHKLSQRLGLGTGNVQLVPDHSDGIGLLRHERAT